jgi:hypothetical protein
MKRDGRTLDHQTLETIRPHMIDVMKLQVSTTDFGRLQRGDDSIACTPMA